MTPHRAARLLLTLSAASLAALAGCTETSAPDTPAKPAVAKPKPPATNASRSSAPGLLPAFDPSPVKNADTFAVGDTIVLVRAGKVADLRLVPDRAEMQTMKAEPPMGLVVRSGPTVNTEEAVSTPNGKVFFVMPEGFDAVASGRTLRIQAVLSSPTGADLDVGYTTLGNGNSGWRTLETGKDAARVTANVRTLPAEPDKVVADRLALRVSEPNAEVTVHDLRIRIQR